MPAAGQCPPRGAADESLPPTRRCEPGAVVPGGLCAAAAALVASPVWWLPRASAEGGVSGVTQARLRTARYQSWTPNLEPDAQAPDTDERRSSYSSQPPCCILSIIIAREINSAPRPPLNPRPHTVPAHPPASPPIHPSHMNPSCLLTRLPHLRGDTRPPGSCTRTLASSAESSCFTSV